LTEGDYQVEIRAWSWNGVNYVSMASQHKTIHVFNGYPHTEIILGVPTTVYRPQVSLALTSIIDCADLKVGQTLKGSYSVADNFFGSASIALVPITIGGIPAPENAVVMIPAPGAASGARDTRARYARWTGADRCR